MNALAELDRLPASLTWKERVAIIAAGLIDGPIDPPRPIEHLTGHGMYIRKMTIPAHTLFIGREHLKGHEVTLLKGEVLLCQPDGRRHLKACKTIHTTPGYHMVVLTLTDIEAQTVHPNPTNSTDFDALEAEIFGPADDLLTLGRQLQLRLAQLGLAA